ncbi:MAG: PilZ domain-containing protein [Porticoccaceae bacterium]|nr:PilZ domain-containing protein [Porticoccaceae bacterium]
MDEKRRFNRIDDSVFLSYKTIKEAELDELLSSLKGSSGQWQKIQSSLAEIDGRINELLPKLDGALPEVASLFQLLNSKVQILGSVITRGEGDSGGDIHLKPSHKISLSAGGVSFHAPDSVRVHDHLEISLTLFPECYFIKAVGRVVSCREALPSAPEFNKLVAVDWVYLDEGDREYTVAHVLKKQAEESRQADTAS